MMVDLETVCCMCGDVGFSDKLFRCSNCRHRYQHSYCSSYYREYAEPVEVCDWCQSEERRLNAVRHGGSSKKSSSSENWENGSTNRSEYPSCDRVKQSNGSQKAKISAAAGAVSGGGTPSPRTATRRYKLLKDVMC